MGPGTVSLEKRFGWLSHPRLGGPDPLTRPGLPLVWGASPPSAGVFFFWPLDMTGDVYPESKKAKHRSSQQPVGHRNTQDASTRVMSPKFGCGAGVVISALSASFWAFPLACWAFDFGFLGFHFGFLNLPLPGVYFTIGLKLGASGFPDTCPQVLRPTATTRQALRMRKTARIFGVAPRQVLVHVM